MMKYKNTGNRLTNVGIVEIILLRNAKKMEIIVS